MYDVFHARYHRNMKEKQKENETQSKTYPSNLNIVLSPIIFISHSIFSNLLPWVNFSKRKNLNLSISCSSSLLKFLTFLWAQLRIPALNSFLSFFDRFDNGLQRWQLCDQFLHPFSDVCDLHVTNTDSIFVQKEESFYQDLLEMLSMSVNGRKREQEGIRTQNYGWHLTHKSSHVIESVSLRFSLFKFPPHPD